MSHRYSYYPPFLIPLLSLVLAVLTIVTIGVAITKGSTPPPVTDPAISGNPDESDSTDSPSAPGQTNPSTQKPSTTLPQTSPPPAYTEVTLLNAGDIMFHGDNIAAGYDAASGSYEFSEVFQYLHAVVSRYDYAVANLETTLSGSSKPYTAPGTASFNAPDSALSAIQSAGFDMMLFANNHTNDRGLSGLKRTVSHLRENGMDVIGASDDKNDDFHKIVDLKGVKLGMLNYTGDGTWGTSATNTLNGVPLGESAGYVNVFYLAKLDEFYAQVSADIADVKAQGADLVVCYIHWGPEYHTNPYPNTKQIAQKLCDLGVDVIMGSHPHVVQPMETLCASDNKDRRTICFYSLGNFLSNQNRLTLDSQTDCYGNDSAYTENGLMVALTIRKYQNGKTLVTGIELIPTWVHRYSVGASREYRILPLSLALAAPDAYELNDSSFGVSHATASLAYTKGLLEDAVAAFHRTLTLPDSAG